MSTMPITSHPITPTEMIVSSVTRESDGLGFGVEWESADFIARGKGSGCWTGGRRNLSKVHAFTFLKWQVVSSVKIRGRGP